MTYKIVLAAAAALLTMGCSSQPATQAETAQQDQPTQASRPLVRPSTPVDCLYGGNVPMAVVAYCDGIRGGGGNLSSKPTTGIGVGGDGGVLVAGAR